MADRDSFIDEVSEELRRDRMLTAWRRWGPWVVGVVVLAVAGAGVATWLDQQENAEARAAGASLIEAASIPDATERAEAFASRAETLDPGPALIARLTEAGALVEAGDRAAAIEVLDAIESDGAADPLYRQLAGFKAALLRAVDLTPSERADALAAYVQEGEPFRMLALEARAAALLEAGDIEGARADVEAVLNDPMVSPSLRQRVGQMQELLGGGEG
ncbi:tetratricopeptide repeat protein [Albimonas sp. CAU 1670]|uniref:tetratricopeptide repeat protein n=1 Tax=Albimonas sp. CAU 1670 TaxID=3032599 RepID=UPI0023DA8F74|nr:tetratricopeptide repeat protein [Albimonas sp. CAU 1670]MDF2232020.1 tetratricopeptide repeat protein [Albimonas sp. CAU 1670]